MFWSKPVGKKKTVVMHKIADGLQKAQKKRIDEAKLDEYRKKFKKKNVIKDKLKKRLQEKTETPEDDDR